MRAPSGSKALRDVKDRGLGRWRERTRETPCIDWIFRLQRRGPPGTAAQLQKWALGGTPVLASRCFRPCDLL